MSKEAEFCNIDDLDERLSYAVYVGAIKTILTLLQKGANPNVLKNNKAIIHNLAIKGDLEMAKLIMHTMRMKLLTFEVDKVATDTRKSALILSICYDRPWFTEWLLNEKANPNLQDKYDRTALHYSVKFGFKDVTKMLLDFGADPTIKSCYEYIPLGLAVVDKPKMEIARLLLHRMHNPKAIERIFLDGVMHCNSKERIDVIVALLDFGVNINCRDPVTGKTCMHMLAVTNYWPLAEILLENGAKISEDFFGRFPMRIAVDHDNFEMIDLFQNHGYMDYYENTQDKAKCSLWNNSPQFIDNIRKKHIVKVGRWNPENVRRHSIDQTKH